MDPRKHFSALNIIHKIIRERVQPGDLCIDATAGRGNDAFPCRACRRDRACHRV